ncbi:MAG: hypothetical protein L0211_09890 [Planctomycetaceae bacterium]|nr:hypothetical protein [Planctomycetaceae bacterium]
MIRPNCRAALAPFISYVGWALLAAASAAQAATNVATTAAPGGGQPVSAKCDSQGVIHLLYAAADGPSYVRSTDGGKTFTNPIAVVDRSSRKPGLEFSAWDMAVGKGGSVHVAMGTNAWKLKLPKEEWAFFYARLDPRAAAFSPVRNLNHQPSEGFSLAADDKGNVTACWLSGKLYASISHDDGASFAPAAQIDSSLDPCDCCTTSAAYTADGRLALLYREETDNQRDMFLVLWDQSKSKVSRTRVSSTLWKIDACPMSYYTIAPSGDGLLAVWPTEGQIYFARLDGRGTPLPPSEIKTPGQAGMRTGMLALNDPAGNTLVTWKKNGQLSWQLYDQKGQPSGRLESVKSAGSGVAGVVDANGRFVLFR